MDRTRDRPPRSDESSQPAEHPASLTAEETQQLLKRAAELDRSPQRAGEPALDFAEVERIGVEAGLSREAIQRAFLELRTGALRPRARPGLLERLFGPQSVTSERGLELPPEEARRRLHELLKAELLQPEERQGTRTTWSTVPGLWAAIQRGLNWQGQSAWEKARLISEVTPAPPGTAAQSVVQLEARAASRGGQIAGAIAPAAILLGAGLSALDPAAVSQGVPFVLGAMGLATAGATWAGIRYGSRKRMRALRLAIERVFEKLTGTTGEP